MLLQEASVPMAFVLEGDSLTHEYEALEIVRIRDTVIRILQAAENPLWSRLFLSAFFLTKISDAGTKNSESDHMDASSADFVGNRVMIDSLIAQYSSDTFLREITAGLCSLDHQMVIFLKNLHFIFYVVNKNVSWNGFNKEHVEKFCCETPPFVKEYGWDSYGDKWIAFREDVGQYRDFLENVCVNYVFCYYSRTLGYNRDKAMIMLETLKEQLALEIGDYYLIVRGLDA